MLKLLATQKLVVFSLNALSLRHAIYDADKSQ